LAATDALAPPEATTGDAVQTFASKLTAVIWRFAATLKRSVNDCTEYVASPYTGTEKVSPGSKVFSGSFICTLFLLAPVEAVMPNVGRYFSKTGLLMVCSGIRRSWKPYFTVTFWSADTIVSLNHDVGTVIVAIQYPIVASTVHVALCVAPLTGAADNTALGTTCNVTTVPDVTLLLPEASVT